MHPTPYTMCLKPYSGGHCSSALNQTAEEWKPPPQSLTAPLQANQFLPHQIFRPSSHLPPPSLQTALPLVTFNVAQPPAMACQQFFHLPYFHFHSYYGLQMPYPHCSSIPQPLTTTRFHTSPAPPIFSAAATPNTSVGMEKGPPRVVDIKTVEKDTLESPPHGTKSSTRRNLRVAKNCMPQSFLGNFEWRPKLATSSDAPPSPPTPSAAIPSKSPPSFPPTTGQNLSSSAGSETKTTVMLKNIPNQFRRDFLLKFLDGLCFEHKMEYDFLYLPMDFRSKDNLGYAFVNLTTGAAAIKMTQILHNYKWGTVHTDNGSITSKKICEVSWAKIQGKKELMIRFQNSCFQCKEMDFLPVILDPPRNGSDPNPSPPLILGSIPVRM